MQAAPTHNHHSRQQTTLASRLSDVLVLHVRSRTRTRVSYPRECSTTPEVLHTIPAGTTAMGGLAVRMPKGSASEATSMDERPSPTLRVVSTCSLARSRWGTTPGRADQVMWTHQRGRARARGCWSAGFFLNNLLTDLFSTHTFLAAARHSQDLPSGNSDFAVPRRAVLSRSPRIPSGTTRDL